ncbi:MAG: hypothetical protein ACJ72N_06955 [Labedaea sp.]
MRDPELFGRIDGVLDECDARQMPPLTEALIPNAEAWRRMGYRVEAHHPSVTVVAAHGTALPVGEDGKGQRLWVVPDGAEAVPYTPTGVLGSPGAWMFTGFEPTPSGWLARLLRRCRRP